MKRTLIATLFFGSLIFASCGGNNAEAEAAKEKARLDSIAAVESELARLDSIANAERMAAELEQARLDSIEAAEAAKKGGKTSSKGSTTKPAETKTDDKGNPVGNLKGDGSNTSKDADKVGNLKGSSSTKTEEEKKKEEEKLKEIRNLKGGNK